MKLLNTVDYRHLPFLERLLSAVACREGRIIYNFSLKLTTTILEKFLYNKVHVQLFELQKKKGKSQNWIFFQKEFSCSEFETSAGIGSNLEEEILSEIPGKNANSFKKFREKQIIDPACAIACRSTQTRIFALTATCPVRGIQTEMGVEGKMQMDSTETDSEE